MKVLEEQFPGLKLLSDVQSSAEGLPDNSSDNELVDDVLVWEYSDTSNSSNESEDGSEPESSGEESDVNSVEFADATDTAEMLTHVPTQPSTYGTDATNNRITDPAPDSSAQQTHGYNLRERNRSSVAIPACITTSDEPSVQEALKSSEAQNWIDAIQEEFSTITAADTYEETTEAPSRALPSGVILKLKRDAHGKPSRFKARLVARGNLQKVDERAYESRYAPVACFDLVRILLALSAAFGWSRHQIDVKGAFP